MTKFINELQTKFILRLHLNQYLLFFWICTSSSPETVSCILLNLYFVFIWICTSSSSESVSHLHLNLYLVFFCFCAPSSCNSVSHLILFMNFVIFFIKIPRNMLINVSRTFWKDDDINFLMKVSWIHSNIEYFSQYFY